MRNPERVLNSSSEHSKDSSYKFERLYRILFTRRCFMLPINAFMLKRAIMHQALDGQIIDNMSFLSRIENLISALKDESNQPQPSRRVYIPKKMVRKDPLAYLLSTDKLSILRGCPNDS